LNGGTLTLQKTDGKATPTITNSNDLHLVTNNNAVANILIKTGGNISIGSIINDDASYQHELRIEETNSTLSTTVTIAGDVGPYAIPTGGGDPIPKKLGKFTVTAKSLAFATEKGTPSNYTFYTEDAAIDLSALTITGTGKNLTLNAGTGNVTLNTVGSGNGRLASLTIISDGQISSVSSAKSAIYTTA
jgi:hypothetical protein